MSADTEPAAGTANNAFDRFFEITKRGSTLSREVRGGIVTFFTMAYIVVLNPLILAGGADKSGAQLPITALAAGTALVAGVMTILMGVVARFPLALAAGLGVNALVAYEIAPEMTWADAMGLVVIEGVLIAILVLTGLRTAVFKAVPAQLKTAIGVGIGLFLMIIGLVDAGFVTRVPDAANTTVPVGLGQGGKLMTWPIVVFVIGLLLTLVLFVRKVKGAILIGILGTTVLAIIVEAVAKPGGWSLNVPALPEKIIDVPDLSLIGQFNVLDSWTTAGPLVALMFIFTLLVTDFFDTMGTMVAVGQEGELLDAEGMPPRTKEILLVDSVAAAAGGAASVSSNTSYVESASGVGEGARTGVASLVTGVLFLVAMFFAPLVKVVPFEAASTALVVVGFLMITTIRQIEWSDYTIAVPAFLTVTLMPFTYSISNGIGAGIISYVVLKLATGKAKDIHPLMYGIAALFVLYFARGPLEAWIL
ncbi:NCS2 family permease [Actinoplanes utahensis]|nr:NCS2 family permease [Actinoplanes utahensis]GIF31872.1 MFS transporter [Actinoplanes utahensis]